LDEAAWLGVTVALADGECDGEADRDWLRVADWLALCDCVREELGVGSTNVNRLLISECTVHVYPTPGESGPDGTVNKTTPKSVSMPPAETLTHEPHSGSVL
jgi:hypothetical protein